MKFVQWLGIVILSWVNLFIASYILTLYWNCGAIVHWIVQ